MMQAPMVSIITPFFNAAAFLAESVESVLAQGFQDWELFLVDDGSTDSSTAIARGYSERHPGKIFYLENQGRRNRGPNVPRQMGLKQCRGRYVALLDSDDVWFSRKLEEQVAMLESMPEAAMLYGFSEYWSDWSSGAVESNHIPPLAPPDRLYRPPELARLTYLLGPCGAPCPSDILFRREALNQVGGFAEDLPVCEDIIFMIKMFLTFPVYVSSHCWDRYRRHENSLWSMGQTNGVETKSRAEFIAWLGQYLVDRKIEDEELWRLYRKARRRFGHPRWIFMMQSLRRPFRPLKRWFRQTDRP